MTEGNEGKALGEPSAEERGPWIFIVVALAFTTVLALILNWLFEDNTILVLDRNQEGVLGVIIPTVASAIMLDLNDDCFKPAYLTVHKKGASPPLSSGFLSEPLYSGLAACRWCWQPTLRSSPLRWKGSGARQQLHRCWKLSMSPSFVTALMDSDPVGAPFMH